MIDVIIFTFTGDEEIYSMTKDCINSIENSLVTLNRKDINVILMESNMNLDVNNWFNGYENADIFLKMKVEFNYNLYLNEGFFYCKKENKFLHILNNDTIVHKGCYEQLILDYNNFGYKSVSTINPESVLHKNMINHFFEGYRTSYYLCGWSIFIHKSIFDLQDFEKFFPIDLKFWYQDNYYGDQLKKFGVKHYLNTKAKITHLESKSFKYLTEEKKKELLYESEVIYKRLANGN